MLTLKIILLIYLASALFLFNLLGYTGKLLNELGKIPKYRVKSFETKWSLYELEKHENLIEYLPFFNTFVCLIMIYGILKIKIYLLINKV